MVSRAASAARTASQLATGAVACGALRTRREVGLIESVLIFGPAQRAVIARAHLDADALMEDVAFRPGRRLAA